MPTRNRACQSLRNWKLIALIAAALSLSACDDKGFEDEVGGVPVYCRTMHPAGTDVDYACVDCEVNNPEAATDDFVRTHATIQVFTSAETQGASISSSTLFFLPEPAGSRPGAFITLPENTGGTLASVAIRIRTYQSGILMQEERGQMGATIGVLEGTLQREDLPGDDPTLPRTFVYFTASQPFDVMDVHVSAPGLHSGGTTETKVYGLCSDGAVIR
jgi:hypothetical protein